MVSILHAKMKNLYYWHPQSRMDYNSVFEAGLYLYAKSLNLTPLLIAKHNVAIIRTDSLLFTLCQNSSPN